MEISVDEEEQILTIYLDDLKQAFHSLETI